MNILSKEQVKDISLAIGGEEGDWNNVLIMYFNLLLIESRVFNNSIVTVSLSTIESTLSHSCGKLNKESEEVVGLIDALKFAGYKVEFSIDFIEHLVIIL